MPRQINEELTRKEMIDPQLEKAGWYLRDHSRVKIEIPVDGYDAEPWNGVSDYTLYRENGEVLAVVEAKRTSVDVRLAEAQLTHYVTEIEKHQSFRPFGFLANGYNIYFVDVGISSKREVFGFFTRVDLENLLYIRQNAKPLSSIEINNEIVDRSYQHEAIRRVGESFAQGKRNALIVFDEVHRSIFNKFNEVLEYFDGRQIGLTATPANYINRDTFLAFDCTDGKPTYLYTYEQAIDDEWLVDYELYAARTKFQRQGIHGVDLTEEERNALIEKGLDPDDINYEGTELETSVSNRDTIRKQWEEIWDTCKKDSSGQLPGKTIIFAITQKHALRLQDVFDEMYPQFPNLTKVITHKSEYRGTLVDAFKKKDEPRIAISVDMLDTGIDVPEVVNLVFMKTVQSR